MWLSCCLTNWQLYRGSARTKSAARRDAVRQAIICSVQLPDPAGVSDIVGSTFNDTTPDFTRDSAHPPTTSLQKESVATHTSSARCQLSTGNRSTSTEHVSTSSTDSDRPRHSSPTTAASPARRRWFNAAAALHDVRPSARYTRQTSTDNDIKATVTVDGQNYDGFGLTWKAAKRSAASRALFHILQLRHLTSAF